MRASRPYLVQNALRYRDGSGRVLIVNPETRAWTATNEAGAALLASCDGRRTIAELAAEFAMGEGQEGAFRDMIHRLVEIKLLRERSAEEAGALRPSCACDGPGSLHLEVTNRCNLQCTHCYVSAGKLLPE